MKPVLVRGFIRRVSGGCFSPPVPLISGTRGAEFAERKYFSFQVIPLKKRDFQDNRKEKIFQRDQWIKIV